jgi:hypothetical protein
MKLENGVITYSRNEVPEYLRFIESAPDLAPSRLGYKIKVYEGLVRWGAAREDYRSSESKRRGIEVSRRRQFPLPKDSCREIAPALVREDVKRVAAGATSAEQSTTTTGVRVAAYDSQRLDVLPVRPQQLRRWGAES